MPHTHIFWSGSDYIIHSAELHSACILSLRNALGLWPRAFLGSRMQPQTSYCRVSYLLLITAFSLREPIAIIHIMLGARQRPCQIW